MRKLKYVTIFPECEPVHLKKDVGMLPYSLGKYCGYDFSIVCYENTFFNSEEKEKFHLITLPKSNNDKKDFSKYILKHAKEIDILNIYHITSNRNLYWILIYKFLNPNGKIHLKLDADYRMIDMIDPTPNSLRGKLKMSILRNKVDLYTVESEAMKDILEEKWQLKMKVVPNGIFRLDDIDPTQVEDKKDIFLTVGRLGTEQKATEDLLSAFELIKEKTDWELILAGSIEDSFTDYKEKFFMSNPDLKERVIFTGNITDANQLTHLYKKAKIFVLPSKWESFALVLMEALECGDYLVVSNRVPSVSDIGRNGMYADTTEFGNVNSLAEAMLRATKRETSNAEMKEMYYWIHENFTWQLIIKKLDQFLKSLD